MAPKQNQDEILYCAHCGISFVWSQEEQRAPSNGDPSLKPIHCPGCRHLLATPGRERGVIKWYNRRKQYGFITRAGKPDLYLHRSNIVGRHLPKPGDLVEFSVSSTPKGPAATELAVLETDSQSADVEV